ncbi:MAG: orotidine-5'-phosphate decarboxylase [Planctomycetia bacterium]|nr:orotidine-5'-phosphate decarboxylase [Planctomycetia bacterium]
MPSFSDRLAAQIRSKRNPVLVGLDPRWEQIPEALKANKSQENPRDVSDVYETFCKDVIDVVAPLVPAVKPQMAFFEQYGPYCMLALKNIVDYASSKGLLVILDGKRNDIGSTATAYAQGLLGANGVSVWGADALTVSPYLGADSLEPFVDVANGRNAGLFILVKTSNPGGAQFQDLVANDSALYLHVARYVAKLSATSAQTVNSVCGYGSIGAVVGATWPEQLTQIREAAPQTWFLVPGYGSQGGGAADVAGAFDSQGLGAIINNSRGIIFAYRRAPYQQRFGQDHWQEAVEASTRDMIDALRAETSAGAL